MDLTTWWDALSTLQKIHWAIALPATLIFLIQLTMTIVGGDADDVDIDSDGGFDADGDGMDDGMHILSVRSIVSFLMFYGWSGLAAIERGGLAWWGVSGISLIVGAVMMLFTAWLFFTLIKLQESGTMKLTNAIGKQGEVYLTIPSKKQGEGKVQIIVQGSYKTLDAMTEDVEEIKTGTSIEVVEIVNGVLIVKRKR